MAVQCSSCLCYEGVGEAVWEAVVRVIFLIFLRARDRGLRTEIVTAGTPLVTWECVAHYMERALSSSDFVTLYSCELFYCDTAYVITSN
jgi:hypothetical protein